MNKSDEKMLSHKSILVIFIIITIINLLYAILSKQYFILSEDQILYVYSDLAQITASIFGLTFAVYSIIDSKVNTKGENDETIDKDIIMEIRKDYFHYIIFITVLSIITILCSLFVLLIYTKSNKKVISFFMNQSSIFFMFLIYEIVKFVECLNPNRINKKSSIKKEMIEQEYSETEINKDLIVPFLTTYNFLEDLVNKYASMLTNKNDYNNKAKFSDSLGVLLKFQYINGTIYKKIGEIRQYRNLLVHSLDKDKTVDKYIYNILEEIYNKIKEIYDNNHEEKIRNQKIKNLYDYSKTIVINNNERKILEILNKNNKATIKEISDRIQISLATVVRIIERLESEGYIKKSNGNGEYDITEKGNNLLK